MESLPDKTQLNLTRLYPQERVIDLNKQLSKDTESIREKIPLLKNVDYKDLKVSEPGTVSKKVDKLNPGKVRKKFNPQERLSQAKSTKALPAHQFKEQSSSKILIRPIIIPQEEQNKKETWLNEVKASLDMSEILAVKESLKLPPNVQLEIVFLLNPSEYINGGIIPYVLTSKGRYYIAPPFKPGRDLQKRSVEIRNPPSGTWQIGLHVPANFTKFPVKIRLAIKLNILSQDMNLDLNILPSVIASKYAAELQFQV
jgi:hypothetical protein